MKVHLTTFFVELGTGAVTDSMFGRRRVLALVIPLLWAAALVLPAFGSQAGVVFTSLHSFTGTNDGGNPCASLVQGSDGNFYGTTAFGGTNGCGTVFKIGANGVLTSLYSFLGGEDGAKPYASLVQVGDSNFYGTTFTGGKDNFGTVFSISSSGSYSNLYSFEGNALGSAPHAGLLQASDGNFYGTTLAGGPDYYAFVIPGFGTVFRFSPGGVLEILYGFGTVLDSFGEPLDGASPEGVLLQVSDGIFYGTTAGGGMEGYGTLFKINVNAGALFTNFYSFTNGDDGANPQAGLVQGSDGNFYGTASSGGAYGGGTVFKICAQGPPEALYAFGSYTNGEEPNGADPVGALVQTGDGNFYGTTASGGSHGAGTIFKISPNGALTSLYSFTGGNDGGSPQAGLVIGPAGSFYGTTSQGGGSANVGTVFRLAVVPEFQAVTLTGATLNLTWSTEPGWTYQLQYTSDLSSSNWSNLSSAITATGPTLNTTDSLTNGTQRFYRLVLSP